jgi:2,4-diketo-3-deoxy-L-fuconate hydrolase
MKLVRYGRPGKEKPGLIDAEGQLRSLADVVPDIGPAQLAPKALARLAKLKADALPKVRGTPRLGVPFTGATKFVAIGLNYSDHAAETGNPVPKEPIVFHKTLSSMSAPDDDVVLPRGSVKSDWEVELGIVIGTTARDVSEADALKHVAGYCVVNDVSEREWQMEHGLTWDKGKGFDTFGPVGPWLVTPDEVGDPGNLDMWLDVNGQKRQRGNTKTMIFGCAKLVAYCSYLFTLNPGDIITTGTPPGVGMGMKPQQFLKPGDVMTLGIEKLGQQRQVVAKRG